MSFETRKDCVVRLNHGTQNETQCESGNGNGNGNENESQNGMKSVCVLLWALFCRCNGVAAKMFGEVKLLCFAEKFESTIPEALIQSINENKYGSK